MRVDETGRTYTDYGVGENGQQIGYTGVTTIGRRILLSGILYTKNLTDTLTVACAMGNNLIDKYIIEPVTLVITKQNTLIKKAFNETITITANAIKELERHLSAAATLTDIVLPSLSKFLTETITITNTARKNITHKLIQSTIVTPSLFRAWISTKILNSTIYVTPTAYKNLTRTLTSAISVVDTKFIGRFKELTEAISVACAMGARSITHKCVESADMIAEQIKMLIRIVEDEVVHINATAYKQPMRSLSETATFTDYIKKIPLKLLAETVSLLLIFNTGYIQHCNEAISIAVAMGSRAITKTTNELIEITITKPINLMRVMIENVYLTLYNHLTINIRVIFYETIIVNPFINGKFLGNAIFTGKKTLGKAFTSTRIGEYTDRSSAKLKTTITTLKKKTGIYKLGDEQS